MRSPLLMPLLPPLAWDSRNNNFCFRRRTDAATSESTAALCEREMLWLNRVFALDEWQNFHIIPVCCICDALSPKVHRRLSARILYTE